MGEPPGPSNLSPSKQPIPPGWTGAEVTYFGLLRPIFGHNYCTIAELLRTKSCQEVYGYSQQVLGDSSLGQWEGPRRLTAKKKKRNMRYMYCANTVSILEIGLKIQTSVPSHCYYVCIHTVICNFLKIDQN